MGIEVDQQQYLKLSDSKTEELTDYMRTFTGPLINQVYGDSEVKVEGYGDLIGLFRTADPEQARSNLQSIADKLKIRLEAVPQFLEDFGDIFLSLSYYKQCLVSVRGLYESDESVIRRPLLKS